RQVEVRRRQRQSPEPPPNRIPTPSAPPARRGSRRTRRSPCGRGAFPLYSSLDPAAMTAPQASDRACPRQACATDHRAGPRRVLPHAIESPTESRCLVSGSRKPPLVGTSARLEMDPSPLFGLGESQLYVGLCGFVS